MSNLIEEDSLLDAKWDPSGSTIAATNYDGHLSIYGIGIMAKIGKRSFPARPLMI